MSEIEITDKDLAMYRGLVGTKRALNKEYGEGQWGDEEIRQYIIDRKTEKQAKEAPSQEEEGIFQNYLSKFQNVTPNDEATIRAMAGLEVALKQAGARLQGEKNPTEIKKLTEAQTGLLSEHRQLQKILGIDRVGREGRRKERSALDEIKEIVADGAEFIDKQLVKISHCGILVAWVLPHFPEMGYQFETRCPRCGEVLRIVSEEVTKES